MATILEKYQEHKNSFRTQPQIAMPGPEHIWRFQELVYRIGALETFQWFSVTAPESTDVHTLVTHYQMMDAYVQNLTQERRYGIPVDEDTQKQRDTAYDSLLRVILDYRRRFGSYAPAGDTQYPADIRHAIGAVIPAWIQYRNTYVLITLAKEAAQ
jgi:hypothetical protein